MHQFASLILSVLWVILLMSNDVLAVANNLCHLVCQRVEERLGDLVMLDLRLVPCDAHK